MSERVLVIAVSARMLAELALDAGCEVVAVDGFGDLDLRARCPVVTPGPGDGDGESDLSALVAAARRVEAGAVLVGAGFENRPDLVAELAAGRELLGTPPDALRAVRDPQRLATCLADAGHRMPATLAGPARSAADPRDGWLRKPLRGGAGRNVRAWAGEPLGEDTLLQRRVDGRPCSFAAVAAHGEAAVLGCSEQLIGERAFGSDGYGWCGNLVPPRLDDPGRRALLDGARAIATALAAAFDLRGLFGVDLVWDGERAHVVEVNPRPSASLEAIDAVHGTRSVALHLAALAGEMPDVDVAAGWRTPAAGKAVLFAREDVVVGNSTTWPDRGIHDVPHPGERILARHPVCTLAARGPSPGAVLGALQKRADDVRAEVRRDVGAHA